MIKKFKFAVLDIDRTLLDIKKFWKVVLNLIQYFDSDFLNWCYQNAFEENRGRVKLRVKRRIDSIIYDFLELVDIQAPRVFEGTLEILQEFKRNRIKIFGTSGSRKARRGLEQVGALDFFELMLGREIPKAKHIPLFAGYLGLSLDQFADKALYIGDEVEDMFLAKRYGLYGIGITNTLNSEMLRKVGAQKIINSLEELI